MAQIGETLYNKGNTEGKVACRGNKRDAMYASTKILRAKLGIETTLNVKTDTEFV